MGEKLKTEIDRRGGEMGRFFDDAFHFILAVCEEIKTRFSYFKDDLLNSFRCLQPDYATNEAFHEFKGDLFNEYLRQFQVLIESKEMENQLRSQWKDLPNRKSNILEEISIHFFPEIRELRKDFLQTKISQFWIAVYYLEGEQGNRLFTELAGFALITLTVPHANADTERLFSVMNYIKNKHKNSLHIDTVEAIL